MRKATFSNGQTKTTKSENFKVAFGFKTKKDGKLLIFFAKDIENAKKRFLIETSYVETAKRYLRTSMEDYLKSNRHKDNLELEKIAKETFEITELETL